MCRMRRCGICLSDCQSFLGKLPRLPGYALAVTNETYQRLKAGDSASHFTGGISGLNLCGCWVTHILLGIFEALNEPKQRASV